MPTQLIFLYGLCGLLIVLGFAALLMQKTYIDKDTQAPTNIQLPGIGVIKTNYPALLFLVAGVGLLYFIFDTVSTVDDTHRITGHIKIAPSAGDGMSPEEIANIDWAKGDITPEPTDLIHSSIESNGYFELAINVPGIYSFEEAYHQLTYDNHEDFVGSLNTATAEDNGTLINRTGTTREYVIHVYPKDPPER